MSPARKSVSVRLDTTGWSFQTKRPLAPKLVEIDGQGDLKFDVFELLRLVLGDVVHDDRAVLNADLRERRGAVLGIGRRRFGERIDQSRPVRHAVRREGDIDGRTHLQRHVGDLDVSGKQRKITQPRRQFVGRDRRLAAAIGCRAALCGRSRRRTETATAKCRRSASDQGR